MYTNIISHKIYICPVHTTHTHSPSQEATHMRTCIYICMYYVYTKYTYVLCTHAYNIDN